MTRENQDLNLHVSLCEQRYKELERRLDHVETRLSVLATEVANLKIQMQTGFGEIRILIERQANQRSIQLIASAGAIIVSLLGIVGYILTRHG